MKSMITKSILVGGALVALSGTSFAGETDVNIYGSSAQFNFWKTAAQQFMGSAGWNCATTIPSNGVPAIDSTGNHGILQGNGCTSAPDSTMVLRFSSKASYDGILAALAKNDPNADMSCGTSAAQLNQRNMAVLPTDGSHLVPSLSCVPVSAGASDVPADSFYESSTGQLKGPNGGGIISRSFIQADGVTPGIDASSLAAPDQVVKVPFGLYVNNSVTANTCTAGRVGDYCSSNLDCTTKQSGVTIAGVCSTTPAVIPSMTREMASLLFSGQITNWSQFGPAFTAQPVVVCLRHAGSGSLATLDLAIMNDGQWGNSLLNAEVPAALSYSPVVWFNDGSSDEKACLTLAGAVGFLDADSSVTTVGSSTAVGPLKYNGNYPSAYAIKNGVYDFWADQAVYRPNTNSAHQNSAITQLFNYLGSDAGLQAANYFQFWAASSSMNVTKDYEITYPHK